MSRRGLKSQEEEYMIANLIVVDDCVSKSTILTPCLKSYILE